MSLGTRRLALLAGLTGMTAAGEDAPARTAPGGDSAPRRYDIELAYIGYTGLATSKDCDARVNPQGYDSLIGTVSGDEPASASDDETVYTGTLRRATRIDFCLARGRRSVDDDERVWCVASLVGTASMSVELAVHGEEGRGAYLKAEPVAGSPATESVSGDCYQAEMDEIRADYPSGQSGASPSGQEINEVDPPKLFVNGMARLRPGYFPRDPVQGGWALRVVRARP